MKQLYLCSTMVLLLFNCLFAQQLAFPGAEGFGKYAKGGRGGKVVTVTNLNDTGTGSFRWALEQYPDQPLTVVFGVSGIINLTTEIKIKRSFLTIAGQTAPGDGICLKGHSLILNGARAASLGGNHGDIIIRYIRSRPGSTNPSGVYGFDMENCQNVIVDHCSFSWANEENAALYDTKNTTVQWCIVSEGLYNAGHSKGLRSYGGVWGGQFASYHHNLIAHNQSRTARFNGARAHDTIALIDYRNNVVYNWGSSNACYGGEVEIPTGVSRINMVANYYKPGQATSSTKKFAQAYNVAATGKTGRWHLSGNVMVGNTAMTADNWLGLDLVNMPTQAAKDSAKSDTAFTVWSALASYTAQQAYDSVLAYAGAILPKRDSVDLRIVHETTTGTAKSIGTTSNKWGIIDSPAEVGGWPVYNTYNVAADTDKDGMPDWWELSKGLNPTDSADGNNIDSTGYTKLELYLNSITTTTGVLPVQLNSFFAAFRTRSQHVVDLSWTTGSEINTAFFEIQKSFDARSFSSIIKVSAYNNNKVNSYHATDFDTTAGRRFYRLKVVDNDGTYRFSHVVVLGNASHASLSVFPNPATNILTITHAAVASTASAEIFDNSGRLVSIHPVRANATSTSIDISNLPKGSYIIVLNNNTKQYNQFIKP